VRLGEGVIGVAHFSGELDFARRDEVGRKLKNLSAYDVAILDMSNVTYVDASFLAELVVLYRRYQDRRRPFAIRLAGTGRQVKRLLELASLDTLVQFFATVDAARSAPLARVTRGDC
jgi:anti-anti-sigma factor